MATAEQRPTILLRRLNAGSGGGLAWLDCVAAPAGEGGVRVMLRAGPEGDAQPAPAGPALRERRRVSGAELLLCDAPDGTALALAGPAGPALVPVSPPEPGHLAGRNVLLAFRLAETPDTVADWLAYHARHHGLTGALVVNRAGAGVASFAADLAAAAARHPGLAGRDLTVVLVDGAVPLGKPGLGPETHLFLAPDAPGKSRMAAPAADPWLSPLGEGLVFEAVKWRFLTDARAVLTLDCCDLLDLAPGGSSAFDRCAGSASGVVLLAGRRIYPWRVRPGAPAAFGDHVCRQFDARRGIARWGVAPRAAGLDKTWRAIRVAFARPEAGDMLPFWRAMALRVPDAKPSELAPKTSLVADPALVALARDAFAANPVLPPQSAASPRAAPPPGEARTCVVTTMKNEGPFILDWLAHHRAIGVIDFLVYSNDCSDGTDRLLDLLAARGLLAHRDNPFRRMPGFAPQHAALQDAETAPQVTGADWIVCMDVDEYINIRIGDGRLPDLYAAMGEANMIALTWRLFGNADVTGFADAPVTGQFTLAAPEITRKPHQAWGFKTLFRNIDIYRKLGVHRPKGLRPDLWTEVRWLNGSGQPMPRDLLRNGWRSSTESVGYDWVQLNHYACRSAESFLVKRDRGRVNHVDRDQGLNYWFRMNHNAQPEASIARMGPTAAAERARLMADPEIAAAHQACCAAHRARVAALLADPANADFFAQITGARLRRLSRMLHHFGAAVFNAGPDVVPADLHLRELAPDFFFTVEALADARH